MAALLAGARLVLRQGLRFLPACSVRPAAVSVRGFPSPTRFLATATQDKDAIDVESFQLNDNSRTHSEGWSLHHFGTRLKKTGRITRSQLLKALTSVCQAGTPSSTQAWFLLQSCGSLMPGVPPSERTEIAETVWSKLQELGVVFNETHYNVLLKIYLENEHKFSPTEFLSTMENAQLQPDQSTYEGLIAAYCNEGDIQGASKILGFMKSTNLAITESVFSSLIRGHARSGDMESAKNILSVMEGAGLVPGRGAYEALLCAYAEKGDIESIKQTLDDCKVTLTDRTFLNMIYCLAKTGHSQFVPDIFEQMKTCTGLLQEVINLCYKLLTQGYGDIALDVAKKFIPTQQSELSFASQPGSFFIRHCILLNLPASTIKTYAPKLEESKLHCSPLQFALYCALENDNKDLALDLIRTLKEEGLPVRPHYCWPLLASFQNEKNVQGFLQVLRAMKELGVDLDVDTFYLYVAELFANAESPESILQENEFREDFNKLYLSVLKTGLMSRNLKRVYDLLSSNIPFDNDISFMNTLFYVFPRSGDFALMGKITKLLFQDDSSLGKPLHETESVGYFLYGLIGSLSDSEVQAKEEHLKQYFHQLKEMGVTLDSRKAKRIIQLLETRNVPRLAKNIKELVSQQEVVSEAKNIPDLEEELEKLEPKDLPFGRALMDLLNALIKEEELDKVLELTSKHGSDFNFAMFMKVLGLCCKKNNPKEALKIKEEVHRRGFTDLPTTTKYMRLLNVLALNGHIEDAINILKEMQERDVAVDEYASRLFVQILNTLAMNGDVDGVNRLHEHLVILGLAKPTSTLCSSLVMVHLQQNDPSAALDTLIQCHEKYKCCPMEYVLLLKLVETGETDLLKKAVDYISNARGERLMLIDLLFVFIESGKYAEAQKIAETPGLRAVPNKITWIFERYARMNKVEAMEKGVELTQALYGCDRAELYFQLLRLYAKNNDWAKAIPLWHKMKAEKVAAPGKTRGLFIKLFKENGQDIFHHIPEFKQEDYHVEDHNKRLLDLCKTGDFNGAYSLFLELEQNQKTLTKTAYARLIKALLEGGLLDNAMNVADVAKNHFSDYSIQNVSGNLLLAEQVRRDCLKDALVTLEKLLSDGSMPSRLTVNRLTEAFAMRGDVGSLEKMEAMTVSSGVDLPRMNRQYLNTKLLAHFRNENFEEATSEIESLCTENPQVSFTYLFQKLIQNNMSEALEKVSIVAERLSAQFSVYRPVTELFLVYIQLEKVDEAKQLLQRCNAILEQSNILRPHIIKRSFAGQKEYVTQLIETLNDPDYKQLGYSCQMKNYIFTKDLNNAVAMYEKMKAEQIEPDKGALKQLADRLRNAGKPVPFPEPQDSVQSSSEEESSSSPSDEKH
ncbi:leucine-rich PPR motif-containing protein, mitochondrial [Rana temporaria]|uniref:leucine-rich PPR motif-containing protein, mitochondrial n=1 Tax=Rana temporaria TaxID=8407 RepID=UPI001AADBFB2|nr:leucine-rich PPR motif-containing protein, mitochondrial [Rana temporaria]